MSVRALGQQANFSKTYIHDLETGRRLPLGPEWAETLDTALSAGGALVRAAATSGQVTAVEGIVPGRPIEQDEAVLRREFLVTAAVAGAAPWLPATEPYLAELHQAMQRLLLPDGLLQAPRGRALSVSALTGTVTAAESLRQAAAVDTLAPRLPGLVTAIDLARRKATGSRWESLERLLLRACHIVRVTADITGHHDLAWLAVQQQLAVAERVGDPTLLAVASWDLCGLWLHTRQPNAARELADAAIDRLDPLVGTDDPTFTALTGAMHLRAAVAAARQGRDAQRHLAEARLLAARVPDAAWWQTMFGPTNVEIHQVEIALERGHPGRATAHAGTFDVAAVPSPERRAHHWCTVAAAYTCAHDDDRAVRALMVAEQLAPQQIRRRPQSRAIVTDVLRRNRHPGGEIIALAARMNITPR